MLICLFIFKRKDFQTYLIFSICNPDVAVDPQFRLWLSSKPDPVFPASVLQAGLKVSSKIFWFSLALGYQVFLLNVFHCLVRGYQPQQ